MGKWGIKTLEKNPDYQDYIQNRRPAEKARAEELRARRMEFERKQETNEVKTFHQAITKDSERKQQILTPAQQLEMRKNVAAATSVKDALAVVDQYIFGDRTNGDADEILTSSYTY